MLSTPPEAAPPSRAHLVSPRATGADLLVGLQTLTEQVNALTADLTRLTVRVDRLERTLEDRTLRGRWQRVRAWIGVTWRLIVRMH